MATERLVLLLSGFLFFPAPSIAATTAATTTSVAQAPAAAAASSQVRSTLTVTVPNDAAELTIEGQPIPGSGSSRTFQTPPLEPGTTYRYTITVTWQPNAYTTMTRSKTVAFRAGEPLAVDLTVHDPTDRVRVQYVPTPSDIADEMVKLAGVTSADVVYEPGCGDGRITIAAVAAGARRAVCIDIDPELVAEARARVKDAGLEDRIEVRLGDALEIADLSAATVVFLYMGDHFNLLIRPILWNQLKPGARVVSHRFRMGDWEPDKTVWVGSAEGSEYELHRWTVTEEVKRKASGSGAGLRPQLAALLILLTLHHGAESAQQTQLFEFHSAFWMNLHHYLQALGRANGPLVEDLAPNATANERAQWASAVDFYRSRYGKRALVFDEELVRIKQQLVAAESRDSPTDAALSPEHRQILERASPIYRKHRWAEHDAKNQRFISALQTIISRHGNAIATRLARSYDSTWPAGGLRVDVVRDAGPPGNAYTTNVPRPTHITMGADDQGLSSLELVFHEASHGWDQMLMKGVGDAAKRLEMRAPPDLWHAILFFNAGRITGDVLAAAGIHDYELYMVKGKVFARPGWHEAIARHWPAFLAGDISREEAIFRILRDLRG